MNLMELVHPTPDNLPPRSAINPRTTPRFATELAGPVRCAILRARQFLLAEQRDDGRWIGREPATPGRTSLLAFWLVALQEDDSELAQQCAATLFELQSSNGTWGTLSDGTVDLSLSVQCYFALKLLGIDPCCEQLARARHVIRRCGGADAADATTRYLLAQFGQVDYEMCPEPADHNSWSTIRINRPVHRISVDRGIRKLFVRHPKEWPQLSSCATRQLTGGSIDHMTFNELYWHAVALQSSSTVANDSQQRVCAQRMRELIFVDEEANTAWPQSGSSAWADTTLVTRSLVASGIAPDSDVIATLTNRARDALAANEFAEMSTADLAHTLALFHHVDWLSDRHGALPPFISICDDSPKGISGSGNPPVEMEVSAATIDEFVRILLEHQQFDGGWSESHSRCRPCGESDPMVTAAAVEALRACDSPKTTIAVEHAADFFRSTQCADGGWRRGWAADDVMATSAAVCGLLSAGCPSDSEAVAAGINWLLVHQEQDGGWSSSAHETYFNQCGSPSSTAWALTALVAAGNANNRAVRRGIEFLLDAQHADGSWSNFEHPHADSGIPQRPESHLYACAWSLTALSRWAAAVSCSQSTSAGEFSLRLVGALTAD